MKSGHHEAINLIFSPQEVSSANHRGLWKEIAKQSQAATVVVDIKADFAVTVAKGRWHRLREGLMTPLQDDSDRFLRLRPLYLVRPEVAPRWMAPINESMLLRRLNRYIPELQGSGIRVLAYSGSDLAAVKRILPQARLFYYVFDEVARTASTNAIHEGRRKMDEFGCEVSEHVFLMSSALRDSRQRWSAKMSVIGNGAPIPPPIEESTSSLHHHIPNSIGLVGNFRDWIDTALLEELISLRPTSHFGILGNVEPNMKRFVELITSRYPNVIYHGKTSRAEIHAWYRKFDVIIVPYLQNSFVAATRPIKIVESVFCGTPVVSVPVSGYTESSFIRFARTAREFSNQIDLMKTIDTDSSDFRSFVHQNSWSRVARRILDEFETSHY